MREVLVCRNMTNGNVSFNLCAPIDLDLMTISEHKRRKLRKTALVNILMPPQCSLDLAEASGIPIADIKTSSEYVRLVGSRIQVLYDSSVEYEKKPERLTPVAREQ